MSDERTCKELKTGLRTKDRVAIIGSGNWYFFRMFEVIFQGFCAFYYPW